MLLQRLPTNMTMQVSLLFAYCFTLFSRLVLGAYRQQMRLMQMIDMLCRRSIKYFAIMQQASHSLASHSLVQRMLNDMICGGHRTRNDAACMRREWKEWARSLVSSGKGDVPLFTGSTEQAVDRMILDAEAGYLSGISRHNLALSTLQGGRACRFLPKRS